MKPSDKILISVVLTAAVVTGLLYWWKPDMHWAVYLGAWFFLSAAGYGPALKDAANEKIVNGDSSRSSS
ncbi:hypothetical protein ACX3X6_12080 [Pseudomonas sichuanensis]|uniref:hypothetical protein n=1 Tax=Pseudomonas TaxID=286 RepID=UPI00230713E3|nr:hypothetical protein [Pseudomonas extremaustralis]MDB1109706.1 hypothetical protein [Pseudomonas extremaustralis]